MRLPPHRDTARPERSAHGMERLSGVNKPRRARPATLPPKVGETNGHSGTGNAEALRRPT